MVEILIHYSVHKDWGKAFTTVLPARKHANLKQQGEQDGGEDGMNEEYDDNEEEEENQENEKEEKKDEEKGEIAEGVESLEKNQ